jgi:hypothetical protein
MSSYTYDVRDIPVLTDAVDVTATAPADPAETSDPSPLPAPLPPAEEKAAPIDAAALQSAIIEDALELADTLTNQAAREIETLLYERVVEQLRAQLPDLVERSVRAHLPGESDDADEPGEPDG